ncbi:hypothetical protein [Nocardia sp. NPDC058666]|uniref:hypothetical protein n=1 Tax=unclassified Nocardia TaxID=2637762 RepID=UPI0036636D7E
MMDQHQPPRASGIARALAVLMLLAGIVAMHSAVFGTAHAHEAVATGSSAHPEAVGAHQQPATPPADHPAPHDNPVMATPDLDTGCGASGCEEHAAVHPCVFVLAALSIALTLVLLYRLGTTAESTHRAPRLWRGRRERPPPWTVLTLSQLAILRI